MFKNIQLRCKGKIIIPSGKLEHHIFDVTEKIIKYDFLKQESLPFGEEY